MDGKQLAFTLITLASISFGAYHFYNSENAHSPNKLTMRNFSTLELAKKAHIKNDVVGPSLLFASQVKTDKTSVAKKEEMKSPLLKESYYKNFNRQPNEIGDNLELLEKEHEVLLQNMRKEGFKIDRITNLKPRLAIAITYHLNLPLGELTEQDLDTLKLSNREWYIIKTFSESKDFALMLKRNSLTSDFIQLDNLTKYYSNS